jgi:protein MpaA
MARSRLSVLLAAPAVLALLVGSPHGSWAGDAASHREESGLPADGTKDAQAGRHAHVIAAGEGGRVEWVVLGFSVRERPIHGWYFNRGAGPITLVFAGIHGNEHTAVELGERLRDRWVAGPRRLEGSCVLLIPAANPDGVLRGTRHNARGVDLNRNFPADWRHIRKGDYTYGGPRPLSEPESRALASLVGEGSSRDARDGGSPPDRGSPPAAVVSIHSRLVYGNGVNNFDGPAGSLAGLMAAHNGYPVWGEWPYRTPGSFGRFAGGTWNIPTLTLELPLRIAGEREWEANMLAVEAVIASHPPDGERCTPR